MFSLKKLVYYKNTWFKKKVLFERGCLRRGKFGSLAPIVMESPQCSKALKRRQRGLGMESGTEIFFKPLVFASKKIFLSINWVLIGWLCCFFSISVDAQSTWDEVYTILNTNCATAGCHAGAKPAGLLYFDLEKHFVHEQIFNQFPQNETAARTNNNRLIYAGDPYRSYIFRKLNNNFTKDAPLTEPEQDEWHENTLSDIEKELIRQWILFGALDSTEVVKRELLEEFYNGNGMASVEEAPEPPEQGFQIHVGPFYLPPGSEQEYFYKYPLDNLQEKVEVVAFDTKMGNSSHHFIIMKFWNSFVAKTAHGLREWDRHDHATFEEVAQESQRIDLPKGSAFDWKENTVLDFNTHYINFSATAVLACDVYINVETQASGTANQFMLTQVIPNLFVNIPPSGVQVEVSDTFYPPNDDLEELFIWSLTSHAHSASIDYDIYQPLPGDELKHVYDASCPNGIPDCANGFYDYERPPTRYFNPFFKTNPANGVVHKTTYINNGTEALQWDWTSEGEMMVFVMRYLEDTTGVEMLVDSALAVDEIAWLNFNKEVLFYPNPTSGILYVETSDQVSLKELEVYNTFGQLEIKTKLHKGKQRVDLSHLKKGIYLIGLKDQTNQKKYTRKIMIQ